jgi:GT2 family glycosyltransferase
VVLQMAQRKPKRTAAATVEHPKLNHKLLGADISLQAGGNATSQATKPTATRTAALTKQTTEEPAVADVALRATVKPKRRPTRTTTVANQTKPSQKPVVADVGLRAAAGNQASQATKPKKTPIPTTAVAKQTESNQKLAVADVGWMADLSRTEIISAEHKALHKRLHSAFERVGETRFFGYVVDPRELHKRFVVEIMLDGVPTKLLRAEQYDPKLRNGGFGDGCYAFEFVAKPDWLDRHHVVEARIANTGDRLGDAIWLSASISHDRTQAPIGAVSWVGGVRLSGWVRDDQNREPGVRAYEGDVLLAETQPDRWAHIENEDQLLAARVGFELWLPETLADGRVHRIRVTDHNDLDLAGSPVSILAFCDGIQSILAKSEFDARDTRRLEYLADLLPMSLPFANYAEWQARFPLPSAPSDFRSSIAVVLVGNGDSEKSLASLEDQTSQQWTAVVLPQGKTAGDVFDPADLIDFLDGDASNCSAVAFAPSGTIFRAHSLPRFTDVLASNPSALIAYGDIALIGQDGRSWPAFFPAFDYERFLEQGYAASCFALRRDTVLSVMSKQATTLFRLFNSVLDGGSSKVFDRVLHLPGVSAAIPEASLLSSHDELAQATKAHLEATGVQADIHPSSSGVFPAVRVRRRIANHPRVAIIVPTRDRVDLLSTCIESVQRFTPDVAKEIIIVDNDSSDAETRAYLQRAAARGVKVLEVPGPFNYSRLNNRAVATISAEYVCLLNNDVQVIEPNWLLELLSRLADPSVGAAGATLIWPNDIVQHGGVTLGPYFGAVHAFNDRIREDPGYCDLLHVARECSAVTAACMLLRRSDYLAVNGMDEALFPVNFNDVDLCLKLRARGYRIVVTPHTALLHFESATRGADRSAFDRERAARELAGLRARWGETVANDPFYNPQLNLDGTPYSGLAWPPRSYEARTRFSAAPREIPPGF